MNPLPYDAVGAHGERVPTRADKRPGTVAFLNHLIAEHGGRSLGIYGNRSIRGGSSKSVHAVSRALDWGYSDRAEAQKVMEALTANDGALARVFGVQAVHDYYTVNPYDRSLGRTWGHGRGWHWGRIGSQGGHWLHIELLVSAAEDPQLMERLEHLASNHTEPEHHDGGLDDGARNIPNPTLREGSTGGEVILLQTILQDWHRVKPDLVSDPGRADGQFGGRTDAALRGFQGNVIKVGADGVYGPQSHEATERLVRFLEAQG